MQNLKAITNADDLLRVLYKSRADFDRLREIATSFSRNPDIVPNFSLYQISQLAVLAAPLRNHEDVVLEDQQYHDQDLELPDLQPSNLTEDEFQTHFTSFKRAVQAREFYAQELSSAFRERYPQYDLLFATTWWPGFADELDELQNVYHDDDPFQILNDYLSGISFDSFRYCPYDGSPIPKSSANYLATILHTVVAQYDGVWSGRVKEIVGSVFPSESQSERSRRSTKSPPVLTGREAKQSADLRFPDLGDSSAKSLLLLCLIQTKIEELNATVGDLDQLRSNAKACIEVLDTIKRIQELINDFSKAIDHVIRQADDNPVSADLSRSIDSDQVLLLPNLYRLITPVNSLFFNSAQLARKAEKDDIEEEELPIVSAGTAAYLVGTKLDSLIKDKASQIFSKLDILPFFDIRDINCDIQDFTARTLDEDLDCFFDEFSSVIRLFSPDNEGSLELPNEKKDRRVFDTAVKLRSKRRTRVADALVACWIESRRHSGVPVRYLKRYLASPLNLTKGRNRTVDKALKRHIDRNPEVAKFYKALHSFGPDLHISTFEPQQFIKQHIGSRCWAVLTELQRKQLIKAEESFRRLRGHEDLASEVLIQWGVIVESQINQALKPVRLKLKQICSSKEEPRVRSFLASRWSLNELLGILTSNKRRDFFSNSKFQDAWVCFDSLDLRKALLAEANEKEVLKQLGLERNRAGHDNERPPLAGTASYFRLHLFHYGLLRRIISASHCL